jgi:hypothetical protein
MHDQFVQDGDHAILDQSVNTRREAERITPGATWGENFALSLLASSLVTRFQMDRKKDLRSTSPPLLGRYIV